MSLNEQTATVQSSAQLSRLQRPQPPKQAAADVPRDRGPLLGLARRLHENETALAFMRNAFRMFQRFGITVSPNHYYWPVPDFRELEARTWPAEEDPIGVDLAYARQLDFLRTIVPQFSPEWESDAAPFFSVSYNYNNGFFETIDAEIAYTLGSPPQAAPHRRSGRRLQQPRDGGRARRESEARRCARRARHH